MRNKLWKEIVGHGTERQLSMKAYNKRNTGTYYTGFDLAEFIVKEVFKNIESKKIWELKLLEPCVGVGNFIFSYLKYVHDNYKLSRHQIKTLIYNIYVCDVDEEALKEYIKSLKKFSLTYFNITLNDDYEKYNVGNALAYDLSSDNPQYIPLSTYFDNLKFDIVITNPPYKNLRAEKRYFDSEKEYLKVKEKYVSIKHSIKKHYKHIDKGTPNIYKCFVEDIVLNYTHSKSTIALLLPRTILSDYSCYELRNNLILNQGIKTLINVQENDKNILANQSITGVIINKDRNNEIVNIYKNFQDLSDFTRININKMIDTNHKNSILILEDFEYNLVSKINKHKRIKDFNNIINQRGEIDLTLNKGVIQSKETNYPLLRGRHLSCYYLKNFISGEYVNCDFLEKIPKYKYVKNKRLACPQISNINKEKRLNFTLIEEGYSLSNSCNFISINDSYAEDEINIYFLLGILNSKLLNWYFKLFSSNNHISNYEIDLLPIAIDKPLLVKEITQLVKNNIIHKKSVSFEQKLNALVEELYLGDDMSEKKSDLNVPFISQKKWLDYLNNKVSLESLYATNLDSLFQKNVLCGMKLKVNAMKQNTIMNNKAYRLSELDMEIIKSIPAGGNWRNIPQKTMNKSKRLIGIQKTGGRTTLYGRMVYDKPSYTITTCFNRPGNGTYIHPIEDRVITTREAARLQGFKDNYYFYGNQKDILNQVGNAIPPFIGYLFGKKIKEKLNAENSIDLFTGAGGLLTGMEEAGINVVVANDIDKSACTTLKINHPQVNVEVGDITSKEVKDKILKMGMNKADIICGGPPCQGFSLSGYRKKDDPRNQLFREFVAVVKSVKPKVLLFENVIGILSSNKGKAFEEIQYLFESLGYNMVAKTLSFDNFGIPQKRKRVLLVGIEKGINVNPIDVFPEELTKDDSLKITTAMAMKDLEGIVHNEEVEFPIWESENEYLRYIKSISTAGEYFNYLVEKKEEQKLESEQLHFEL
ncbi:Alw26I/Eco31I/Esp3I family type II restriction adenine-specific DNA-methyltransferase [Staphylococcus simulans]